MTSLARSSARSPLPDEISPQRARAEVADIARSPQFRWISRAGFVARGVIYGVIGILAIKLALGDGGRASDQRGALSTIAEQPFGKVLLIVTAIGLFGYAVWRIMRAVIGHGPESGEDSGLERAAGFVSGLVYGGLCVTAIKIVAGSSGRGGSNEDQATAGVLGWPAGPWLVGIGGAILVGVGLYQAREGLTERFLEKSKTEQMSEAVRRGFTAVGVVGHLARAVVFGLIGYFLVKAAIDHDADKAVGLDGALAKLGQAAYGPVLLGIVAAGLIAFAVYSIADARYRKV